eukprot:2130732-Amphidinium_carterae.1
MAWGQGKSRLLMGELLGMLLEGQPTAWQNRNKPQKKQSEKPKRGDFGDGWHCGLCGFYNFGGRTKCFKCKTEPPPGTAGGKPSPGQAGGKSGGKGGSGKNSPPTQAGPRPEQVLTSQLNQATDAPVKQALQDALDKVKPQTVKEAKFQSLSLRDQRASLLSRAQQLADKIDRQCEIVDKA